MDKNAVIERLNQIADDLESLKTAIQDSPVEASTPNEDVIQWAQDTIYQWAQDNNKVLLSRQTFDRLLSKAEKYDWYRDNTEVTIKMLAKDNTNA